jgi:hypothetical protein
MIWQLVLIGLAVPPAILAVRQLKRDSKPRGKLRLRLSITLTIERDPGDRPS